MRGEGPLKTALGLEDPRMVRGAGFVPEAPFAPSTRIARPRRRLLLKRTRKTRGVFSVKHSCLDMSPACITGIRKGFHQGRHPIASSTSSRPYPGWMRRREEGQREKEALRCARYLRLKRLDPEKRRRSSLEGLLASILKTARARQISLAYDSFLEGEGQVAEEVSFFGWGEPPTPA